MISGTIDIEFEWTRAFAPPPKLTPSEWAEANIILPAATNSQPGPLRLASYQIEPINALADPDVETIVLQWASQTGKSTVIDASLGYVMNVEPGPTLLVHPTTQKAEQYITDRLDPLIAASPAWRSVVGGGRKGGGDAKDHKLFQGGSLNIASSYKPDDLAARAIRFLNLDEVDRFAQSAGGEGDPVALAIKRTRTWATRKIIVSSTPTLPVKSRVAAFFARSDQRRFFCACPECGTLDYFRFDMLKWERGRPETAYLQCDSCGAHWDEKTRLAMVDAGEWSATAKGEHRVRGYHATELMSKFSSLASVAAQAEAAVTPDARRVFVNTVLAETYDGSEAEIDVHTLKQKAEPIHEPLPKELLFVAAGIDIQSDRIECSYIGVGRNDRTWVIDHVKLFGDTSAPQVWADLDGALGRSFQTIDRRALKITVAGVDAGFNTTRVAQFVVAQRSKGRRVLAVKGQSGWDKPTIREGNKIKGLTTVFLIGVDNVKLGVQKRLAMMELGDGFIHLPDHLVETKYFDQLCSEKLLTRYVRGYSKTEYHKVTPHQSNEGFDCLVYAVAVASLVRTVDPQQQQTQTPVKSVAERAAELHRISNEGNNYGR